MLAEEMGAEVRDPRMEGRDKKPQVWSKNKVDILVNTIHNKY